MLAGPATVKAIGMWGSGANVKTYPTGYGFVPSSSVSANYTSASGALAKVSPVAGRSEVSSNMAREVMPAGNGAAAATLESVTVTPSQPVVAYREHNAVEGDGHL
jgi:hypothetical protein